MLPEINYDKRAMKPINTMKMEKSRRLKTARERQYKTAADFARTIPGMDEYTYRTYESGRTEIPQDKTGIFAEKLGISLLWLLTGKNDFDNILSATIRGKIIDGGFIVATLPLTGEISMNTNKNTAFAPQGDDEQGNSTLYFKLTIDTGQYEPYIKGGSEVYYFPGGGNPADFIGEACVMQIKGGKPVYGVIQRGSADGLYDVQGHGKDLEIEWCALVELIKRTSA